MSKRALTKACHCVASRRPSVATREIERALGIRVSERGDVLATKHATEHRDGYEEAGVRRAYPPRVSQREPAGRHDAVHMRMAHEGLSPGVQDGQSADLRAEMARVRRDLAQRRCARLEKPRVHLGGVP